MRLLLLLASILTSLNAYAVAPCEDANLTYRERLDLFSQPHCYLEKYDAKKLSKNIDDALSEADATKANLNGTTWKALDVVETLAKKNADDLHDNLSKDLLETIIEAKKVIQKEPRPIELDIDYWKKDYVIPVSKWKSVKDELNSQQCWNSKQTQNCDGIYESAKKNIQVILLVRRIVDVHLNPLTDEYLKNLFANRDQWHAYVYDMQFQYPWELGFNKTSEKTDAGWQIPPTSRWILFHPDIGIGLANNQPSGSKSNAALQFQWIGKYWWSGYGSDNRPINPVGLSLVSTVADLATGQSVGYGMGLHYKTFNLSITKHSSSYFFLVNLNLFDSIQDKSAAINSIKQW